MPQLVGQPCAGCGRRIGSDFTAEFCSTCGLAVHRACLAPPPAWMTGRCARCGAADADPDARLDRLEAVVDDLVRREGQDRVRERLAERPPPARDPGQLSELVRLKLLFSAVLLVIGLLAWAARALWGN